MAYTKINWKDLPDTSTPITAENLNKMDEQIEENTNSIDNLIDAEAYSTSEIETNKVWIDGKPIYRKVINVGSLPNNTQKVVASDVNFGNSFLTKMYGVCKHSSSNIYLPLPFSNPSTLGYSIMLNIDNQNNVVITTGTDRTDYNGYVVIEYTKTTN